MTESNHGPATPGTAARCEICQREMADTYVSPPAGLCSLRWPSSEMEHWRLGYERLKAENAFLRANVDQLVGDVQAVAQDYTNAVKALRRARELLNPDDMNESFTEEACDVLDAALSGEEAAGPAEPAPEVVSEPLPTRASLLESLRAAEKERLVCYGCDEEVGVLDGLRPAGRNGLCVDHSRDQINRAAAAEQRAEAAEKRATDLEKALRAARDGAFEKIASVELPKLAAPFAKYHEEHARHGGASQEFHERAASFLRSLGAALHDEERPHTMEVTHEVVTEAIGENRSPVLDRAGEQGAEPGARTGTDRLVDAARDRSPDQVLGGSGRGLPEKVLDERASGLDEERSAPPEGRIENYYGCCDRPPTFTDGAGSDLCPEHSGEAFSRWVPASAAQGEEK